MDLELLRQFCSLEGLGRKTEQPWSVGEFSFATNGHVLIKVPRMSEIAEMADPIDTSKVWPKTEAKEWIDVSGYKAPTPAECPKCGGKPSNPECPECEGEGEVEASNKYNTYTVECATCDGTGVEPVCSRCDGDGVVEVLERVPLGHAGFSKKYLALLSQLPNCQISTIDEVSAASFRFDGGAGVIMPMRP